jgi:hypothetical protein
MNTYKIKNVLSISLTTYFYTITVCWAHKDFWNNFLALVVDRGSLHNDCSCSKYQKQKRVHVEQCSKVAVLD